METKGTTRRRLREQRRRLAAARDLDEDARALAKGVAPFVGTLGEQASVLSYESLLHEPPTTAINTDLVAMGHRVLVPITLPDMRLDWCRVDDPDRLPLGIDTPREADLALVPGLAVDTSGTRLGQGGGCYDRVLPMLAAGTAVVVLLHPGEQTTESLPREDHDVPVHVVLTAEGSWSSGVSPITER